MCTFLTVSGRNDGNKRDEKSRTSGKSPMVGIFLLKVVNSCSAMNIPRFHHSLGEMALTLGVLPLFLTVISRYFLINR